MSISGDFFIFDGIPSDQFGLTFYTFEKKTTEESDLGVNIEIVEDRIRRRSDPIDYGITDNKPLTFSITFGGENYLDRYDTAVISKWLTGHQQYKILEIFQPDMGAVRYRCRMNNLKTININESPVAFKCDVVCDCQYGYTGPFEYSYAISGSGKIMLRNISQHNGYLYPLMTVNPAPLVTTISIANESDNNRKFELADIPNISNLSIYVDNKNQIITSNSDVNLYEGFNNKFLRLINGNNTLNITGSCTLVFKCEFLVRLGG